MSVLSLRGMPRTLSTSGVAARKGFRALRREGLTTTAQRVVRYTYTRLGASALNDPLKPEDIADSTHLDVAVPVQRPQQGQPLVIGWICTPPAAGSGGHTTMFRMIEAIEAAGHRCILFLYDRHSGDLAEQARIIHTSWPKIRADVRDVKSGITGVDAAVATSWESAHVLAQRSPTAMRRLYFVQDFEPYFYPRGSIYALAEDSYRFGFRCIALGEMVAEQLRREVGIDPDVTQFGCDTDTYYPTSQAERVGVVFYTKPEVPRRGYWLGKLALEAFHAHNPDIPIHIYGSTVSDLTFPAFQHANLTPAELNRLYNTCVAGIAMSFTNISLVAEEMLAAGVIPVVNDSTQSRADLHNDFVAWASPTPLGIANALHSLVQPPVDPERAAAAANSTRRDWSTAQADVLRIIEEDVYGH